MGTMLYESLNGRRFPAGTPLFTSHNRAFRYGDGIFETIRLHRGQPLFMDDHLRRLKAGISTLGFELHDTSFEDEMKELAHVNGAGTGRARLTVFREDGGYYAPQGNSASWHLNVTPGSGDFGSAMPQGLAAETYNLSYKTTDAFSGLKSCNALLYVLAGKEANRAGVDEMIISNSFGRVAEFISGNLFMLKNDIILTPPLSEGCIDGVMRRQVMTLLMEMNVPVKEQPLTADDLEDAGELWCTNVIRGVAWVRKLGDAGYGNKMAEQMNSWLNKKWLK